MAQKTLDFKAESPGRSISPIREMGAYEAIWMRPRMTTFARVATVFREHDEALPSDLVPEDIAVKHANSVLEHIRDHGVKYFGVRVHRAGEYPAKLRDAAHPVELLYFRGAWDLVESQCVAIVGTRHPSEEGLNRTRQLARHFVSDDWTVVSGLATGVDSCAHRETIQRGGRTIAVIGTPICEVYPRENADLQQQIARNHLLISQVPVERYRNQIWKQNRGFFPERNVTMSALTAATVIVEAGDTSGTLFQARAALAQGRRLFILDSCFKNPHLQWPAKFEKKGAIRVKTYEEIRDVLRRSAN